MSFNPNNPTVEPENFKPSNFVISTITQGRLTIVSTSVDNNFVLGQQVRFNIPQTYGIRQLNGQAPQVVAINSAMQFVVDVDSARYDPFIPFPPHTGHTPPQVNAVGDFNISFEGFKNNAFTISGAFVNISN